MNQRDQDRDTLARAMGWKTKGDGSWCCRNGTGWRFDHPVPPTREAALAAKQPAPTKGPT